MNTTIPSNDNATPDCLGFIVAKAIEAGDIDRARREAGCRRSWAPAEARAIIAACHVARTRFDGCSIRFAEFV